MRLTVRKWQTRQLVGIVPSLNRNVALTKISEQKLNRLEQLVFENRGFSAVQCKNRLNLQASTRTVQKYLRILGWKKIRSKYCQFVSIKNRVERIIYSSFCIATNDKFANSIFIDESTIQADTNSNKVWYKPIPGETRHGLIGKYQHPDSVHVLGGISRNGKTPLIIFRGKLNSSYFCELAEEFLLPFIQEKYPINHRLHMDNAPSHSSAQTRNFLNNEGVLHFKTPAQSPDLNPIKARLNWCK